MKQAKERLITKGWKTSILGILLFLFTGCLLWFEKSSIGESIPLFFIALILLGVKDDIMTKIKNFKLILILFLAFTFTGCVTQKKCNSKFPPVTIIKDSIIETTKTVIRDTTVFVKLPNDTVTIKKYIYIKDGKVNLKEVTKKNGIVSASFKIVNNESELKAWINDSGVFVNLKNAITERDKYKEIINQTTITPQPIEVNKLTQWQIFQMWLGRILAVIIIGFLAIKAIKLYIR